MPESKQTHIFATRQDLVPGLSRIEAELEIRYALCGMYEGTVFEQYTSLLVWAGLGKNTTGDHMSGPQFLVLSKSNKFNLEPVLQSPRRATARRVYSVAKTGEISPSTTSLEAALGALENDANTANQSGLEGGAYSLTQKSNPDSIVFSPGGVYRGERVLICGHIGTVSQSPASLELHKQFVKRISKSFEKIGSYYVGPEAAQLMQQGYRMVTSSIGSSTVYDLTR